MGFVFVEVVEEFKGVFLHLLALGLRERFEPFLVLVADVVAVDGFVTDDQTDHIGGVGELRVA